MRLPKVPLMINSDAYTVGGDSLISQDAKEYSCYNYTNRIGPEQVWDWCDSRMVLYGLSDFIKTYLSDPMWMSELLDSVEFMKDSGVKFNSHIWDNLRYLPITIKALPEGSVFYPGEPIIEVSAESPYGEMAALVEPLLVGMVSIASARATVARHLLERMKDTIKKYHPDRTYEEVTEQARWMIHDFGFRASSCGEEANLLGRAHLLSFNGTDTFGAAYQARQMGLQLPAGTSIPALAHRTVQSYECESDCFEHLFNNSTIGSYVADCYDFGSALDKLATLAQKSQNENLGKTIVVRPDSGDYIENTKRIVTVALENKLYALDELGRPTSTTLRFIHGDSMNYEKMMKVFRVLQDMGVDPTGWCIFGIGGWLRNSVSRDTFSSAYKLCAVKNRKVIKLSETPAKMSIPGQTRIIRVPNDYSTHFAKLDATDEKRVYYNCGKFTEYANDDFQTIRDRVQEFPQHYHSTYGYQLCLSKEIREFQEMSLAAHQ